MWSGARQIAHLGNILRIGLRHGAARLERLPRLVRRQRFHRRTTCRTHHGEQSFGVGIERHARTPQLVQPMMAAATSRGLVEFGEMPGAGDHLCLRPPGNSLGDTFGIAARHDAIVLTPDQQRRRADQLQPLLELRVAERPEDARSRFVGARLFDRPFDRIGALRHRLQRLPDFGIGAHQSGHRIGTLRPRIGRWIGLVEQAERRDQCQPSHACRPQRRHLRRHRCTH